jgi:hypothetical protein
MSNRAKKLLRKAIGNPGGLRFQEATTLAAAFGFEQTRRQGSHRIFKHVSLPEFLNLQEVHGMAKAYQVRQLLRLVERYNLQLRVE